MGTREEETNGLTSEEEDEEEKEEEEEEEEDAAAVVEGSAAELVAWRELVGLLPEVEEVEDEELVSPFVDIVFIRIVRDLEKGIFNRIEDAV